jgi:nucleotide-binding universal stress UspA family protein
MNWTAPIQKHHREAVLALIEAVELPSNAVFQTLERVRLADDRVEPASSLRTASFSSKDSAYKDSRRYLTRIQDSPWRIGVASSIHLVWGNVVPTIVEFAEREKVHLVAMASHGRRGLSRFYYGSAAAGVLHRINCPLLIVRSMQAADENARVAV